MIKCTRTTSGSATLQSKKESKSGKSHFIQKSRILFHVRQSCQCNLKTWVYLQVQNLVIPDQWESSMIGKWKNSELAKNQSTKATKKEDSKISSDSSNTPSDTLDGSLTTGSILSLKCLPSEQFSTGLAWSTTGRRFLWSTTNLMRFCYTTVKTLKEPAEEWKVTTLARLSIHQTSPKE